MPLPRDFDIFLPCWSRIRPCRKMSLNGTCTWPGSLPAVSAGSSATYMPNIIIRATQKKRMS
ncbi:Uncharacterised protein [Mycobacteroides abscessus subsp. abscessus]|nr:Uncharacterised protein [Mycobacteroides abscessus subsp. abscessus]